MQLIATRLLYQNTQAAKKDTIDIIILLTNANSLRIVWAYMSETTNWITAHIDRPKKRNNCLYQETS